MLNKHRRKKERRRELLSLKQTMKNLDEKSAYLEEQKKFYNDYINSCMNQFNIQNRYELAFFFLFKIIYLSYFFCNSKTKKAPLPFSKQYFHYKKLIREGNVPQYGSFKYTAADLYKKGVLVSIEDFSPKQFSTVYIMFISCLNFVHVHLYIDTGKYF